jgi:type VI secretion system protein ImpL
MIRRFVVPIIRSFWVQVLFGGLVLSLVMWRFSPYVGSETFRPFDSVTGRVILLSVFWLLIFIFLLIRFLRKRRKGRRIETQIVNSVDPQKEENEAVAREVAEMRTKLRDALTKLRKTKAGRRSLNDLPWYVMIGPPGAGKTTAIVNSGLNFPLADEFGKTAIGGVGGTRNCDWWFTENAVMIDTAGRYTTQESDQSADNAGWLGFLNLIKKNRPRQPINGAIVAISLSDLSLTDEVTQKGHARAIRRRLQELRDKLEVRFPVYVLFTKADLIAGFTEFFDDLGKEEREQVWGFTLPLDTVTGDASPVAAFDTEFAALLAQLNAQSLEKMQSETDHHRRSLIAGFPSQVASLRAVAQSFLAEVFQDSKFEQRHMLRGVYFTSGTQEGTPIDRLMMTMARTFGIGRQAIGSGRGTGRSFFLTRLFEQVMFPESGLVAADDKVERRYRWAKRGAIAATILFAGVMGWLWISSFIVNQNLLTEVENDLQTYQSASAAIPGNPVGDTDLPGIVEALNTLRDVRVNPIPASINPELPDPMDPPSRYEWGLYQGEVLANQTGQAYRAALNQHLLPRLLLRLEEQIQGSMQEPELLYEALKVYLMLGLEGPMDTTIVRQWMELDWSFAYPGEDRAQLRADLLFHLDAMLSQPMVQVPLHGDLVAQAQGILSQLPLADRVYQGIINSPAALALEPWRLTDVGGPAVARVLVRSSGKPLNDGIDGIFTHKGFNEVFLEEAVGVATRVQNESWVMGESGDALQSEAALAALSTDVLNLYYNDFIARYDAMLGDVDIVPMESLSHAVEVTNVLSGPTSPIVSILNAVSEETKLTQQRTAGVEGTVEEVSDNATGLVIDETLDSVGLQTRMVIETLLARQSQAEGGGEPDPPGYYVEERFQWLHDLVVKPEGASSRLEELMVALQEVYNEMNRMSLRGGVNEAGTTGSEALLRFQESASRVEGPLQRWAQQITVGSSGIAADGTRAGINAAWQSQVLPFCTQVTEGRYPFDRLAAQEVGIPDFTKLFGPEGLINTFFNDNLASIVDTSTRPWSFKAVNNVDLGISPAVLQQFEYAAQIRDAFFASGAIGIQFQLLPYALGQGASAATLLIDGTNVTFTSDELTATPLPRAVTWPGDGTGARFGFSPSLDGVENAIARDTPWGWFRLLDAAEIRPTSTPDRVRMFFTTGGRNAVFDMQTSSVLNPFQLAALQEFACPSSF